MTDPEPQSNHHKTLQVEAIAHGTVVDHIPAAVTLRVAQLISETGDQVFIGVNLRSSKHGTKGVVKVANRELSTATLSRLALLAPRATMCLIRDYRVTHKAVIPRPTSFIGIAHCANVNCITNHESWTTSFTVIGEDPMTVRCHHCEREFPADELSTD